MADKLNAGAHFPRLTLQFGDGTLVVPELMDAGYSIILFYRGHW